MTSLDQTVLSETGSVGVASAFVSVASDFVTANTAGKIPTLQLGGPADCPKTSLHDVPRALSGPQPGSTGLGGVPTGAKRVLKRVLSWSRPGPERAPSEPRVSTFRVRPVLVRVLADP